MSIYDEMLDDPSMIPDTKTVNPNPPNPEDFEEQGETGDLQPIGPNTQATEQLEPPTIPELRLQDPKNRQNSIEDPNLMNKEQLENVIRSH